MINAFDSLDHTFISKDTSWLESNSQISSFSLGSSNLLAAEPPQLEAVSSSRQLNSYYPDNKDESSSPWIPRTSATSPDNDCQMQISKSRATTLSDVGTPESTESERNIENSQNSHLPFTIIDTSKGVSAICNVPRLSSNVDHKNNLEADDDPVGLNSSDSTNSNSSAGLDAGQGQRQQQRQGIQGQKHEKHGHIQGQRQDREQQKQGQGQSRALVASHTTATVTPTPDKSPFHDFLRKKHKSGYRQKKASKETISKQPNTSASARTTAAQAAARTTSGIYYNPMMAAAAQFYGGAGNPAAQLGYLNAVANQAAAASQHSLVQPQHQPLPMLTPTIFMQPGSRKQIHMGGGNRNHHNRNRNRNSHQSRGTRSSSLSESAKSPQKKVKILSCKPNMRLVTLTAIPKSKA